MVILNLTCKDCQYTQTCPRFDECSFLLAQNHIKDETNSSHVAQLKAKTTLKFLDRARQISELSDFQRVHIGCVAVYGNKIISSGFNSNRTHPLQARLNRLRNKDIFNHTIHAEISCLTHIWNSKLQWNKVRLYVYRTRCDQRKGMSRPCPARMAAIKQLGIRNIFYTTIDGYVHEFID